MKIFKFLIVFFPAIVGYSQNECFFVPNCQFDTSAAFNWINSTEIIEDKFPLLMYIESRGRNGLLIEKFKVDSMGNGQYEGILFSGLDTSLVSSFFFVEKDIIKYPILTGNFKLSCFGHDPFFSNGSQSISMRSGSDILQVSGVLDLLNLELERLYNFFKVYHELKKSVEKSEKKQ